MKNKLWIAFVAILVTAGVPLRGAQFSLSLIWAKIMTGSFVPGAICTDSSNIYAGTFQGDLVVMAKTTGYPTIARIHTCNEPLRGVCVDGDRLLASSGNGRLYVYNKYTLAPITNALCSPEGLGRVMVVGDSIFVAEGETRIAVTESNVFVSQFREGEHCLELDRETLALKRVFGEVFNYGITLVYDRNGTYLGSVPNVGNGLANVYANTDVVVRTSADYHGQYLFVSRADTLQTVSQMTVPNANVAAMLGTSRVVLVGTESGKIHALMATNSSGKLLTNINLPQVTGFTGPEQIEIRDIHVEPDGMIYAGTSWPDESVPSLFILKFQEIVSKITSIKPVTNGMMLQITGVPGNYEVQTKSEITSTNWTSIGSYIVGTNCLSSFIDTNISSTMKFYRTKSL